MFKPISTARSSGKFRSFDELAKRLVSEFTDLDWPAPRALAVKLGDIDRGDKVWWTRRPSHASALATLLEAPLVDLGLHDAPAGDAFQFTTFPELAPITLARETSCEIGFPVSAAAGKEGDRLAFWLDVAPPRHAWRGPDNEISWLEFLPGTGLSFFWAALRARTRHEHMVERRLRDAGERLRQAGNLILLVEQPCDNADLIALAEAHRDLNLLIVAPFSAPEGDTDAPSTWLPSWEVLTGQIDGRMAALRNPQDFFNSIARYEWRIHDDWQARLLDWVEKRISRTTDDTLFTAKGVANWLSSFPEGWQFVRGPADLLAVCRLCHLSRETELPRVSDLNAGQRLLEQVTRADKALSRRFKELVDARLAARQLSWNDPLTAAQWAAFAPAASVALDETTLLSIANGANQAERRKRAMAVAEYIQETGIAPLIEARFLVETRDGMLVLAPQFLVDLVARDLLMQIIREQPVDHWAMYCHDKDRRVLIDAALGSMSIGELLPVLDRIKEMPADALARIGAGEALFWEIGKRLSDMRTVPEAFACLAGMVLPRLAETDLTPAPWTRPADNEDESLEWNTICWAWSIWCDRPPMHLPESWTWHFPGWAPDLAVGMTPWFWPTLLPDRPALSYKWKRMMAVAGQLVQKFTRPPEYPPEFLAPILLAEGIRGRWPVDFKWLEAIMSETDRERRNAAENLLLRELNRIGSTAAPKLLPFLMEFLFSGRTDGMRQVLFYRSRIRTWVLEHVSYEDVSACLDEVQLEALWQVPHSLPPRLLLGMLADSSPVEESRLPARIGAIRVLGAEHVDALTRLLGSESLGMAAAERLWKVSPETVERTLTGGASTQDAAASLRVLILSAPLERTGVAADAVLDFPSLLAPGERADWAKPRLPNAQAHTETLWAILDHSKAH
ncbi:hypothetical protein [Massilia sp. Root335]|uniref:hypothetical protein n=1 Tax=Massilia sp. Root335 TaxID=1736517 RepID=UPI0006FC647F|nr:hypothetical protein [Massilia sp. Root335]KQV46401.1 hypothetical protein ASC93_14835 [Massilia sp. Root335]